MSDDVPPVIEDRLRAICLGLPESYEEPAWVGTRWRVRKRTIAHVRMVEPDNPTASAARFATDGPVCALTFRAPADEVGALTAAGLPFYRPGWGTDVVGMLLGDDTDWVEVAELLTESYRVLAPKKLVARLDGC
jgi:hypothetical protein